MAIHTVLVIDDSPTERHYLVDLLQQHGFRADTAASGEEGMAKAKAGHPDLILLDVVMPGLNGFQVTRMLARDEQTKDIPVILCTTKSAPTDHLWGMRQGAAAYLVKPVAAVDLLEKIRGLA